MKNLNYNELGTLETFLSGWKKNILAQRTGKSVINSLLRMKETRGQLISLLEFHQAQITNWMQKKIPIQSTNSTGTFIKSTTNVTFSSTENQKIQALFDSFLMIAVGNIQQISPLLESIYFKKSDVKLRKDYNLGKTIKTLRAEIANTSAVSLVGIYDEVTGKTMWKDLKYLRDGVAHKYSYEVVGGYDSFNEYNAFISYKKRKIPVVILCKNISSMIDELVDEMASKLKSIK